MRVGCRFHRRSVLQRAFFDWRYLCRQRRREAVLMAVADRHCRRVLLQTHFHRLVAAHIAAIARKLVKHCRVIQVCC